MASPGVASCAEGCGDQMGIGTLGSSMSRYFIVGGAGFIGSHFCDRLMAAPDTTAVTIYDNFSSGRDWHIAAHQPDNRFRVVRGDVKDAGALTDAMAGPARVIPPASQPHIPRAATEPDTDSNE